VSSQSSCFFLKICQVLTGEQPFRGIKPLELAFQIPSGLRPARPENAEAIGISESLWELIQKCWDGKNTRRPQVQEVVDGVANAVDNWHVLAPPGAMEHWEDSVEEDSDELQHGEFSLFSIVPPVFRPSVQPEYSRITKARARVHQVLAQAPAGNPAMGKMYPPH
jgi:hypothetical protein